jgi:uncharacterized protein
MIMVVIDGVRQDKAKAIYWYMKAAEQGYQCLVGAGYVDGDGVKKDKAKAFHWFMKAAEQGHIGAQWSAGTRYDL